ncbi:hypothetical protein RvY_11125 [Ramazzottius varieornatus]|uniref:GP-PDE domain-containing protein n=1 Tax=Ramazzottius varieornatus TaxID=947166 RepID=A0A1D1VJH1_RAMVA|nr:hypothetical protein RvY_11125 [Ramazzottius varieornatus]
MAVPVKWFVGLFLLLCFTDVIFITRAAVVAPVRDSLTESSGFSNCPINTPKTVRRLNINELAIDKQGHRGCRGLMPENTVIAMLKALELGVDTLEMDTVITNDGQVILSHEPFFSQDITTKPDGTFINQTVIEDEHDYNIYRMNYSQVIHYDVGLKFHPRFQRQQKLPAVKPLLRHVFTSVKSYCQLHNVSQPFYNIETKTNVKTDDADHPIPSVFVDTLMSVIQRAEVEDRVIIQSFDFRTLQYLHEKYPTMKTAMLIDNDDERTFQQQLKDLGFAPTIHSPHRVLVTRVMVETCHGLGIKIIPWTVNDVAEMRQLIELGVDGLITDYPNLFSELENDVSTSVGTTIFDESTSPASGKAAKAEVLLGLFPMIIYLCSPFILHK